MNKWFKKIKRFVFEKLLKPVQHLLKTMQLKKQHRKKIRQLKKQHDKKIKQLTNEYAKTSKTPSTRWRAFWVLLMGVVVLWLMTIFGFIYWEGWMPTFKEVDSKPIIQLSNLIIVAPIAFIVWVFRDQNHLRTLSNARKDTNLKEFQQLQEWATESGEEKGNEALQISALHSLRGYLKGEYGEDFRRGTFEIFTSALHAQHQKILADINDKQKPTINSIKTAIENDELCKQLNRIAQEDWFNLLINHNFHTATISLVGVDLSGKYLRCTQYGTPLDLSSANLQGVNLHKAQLQGVNLQEAQLQGVDLYGAQLQGADLQGAQLQGAYLYRAQLQGVYTGDPHRISSFEQRINQQTDEETENEKLINQYKLLNNEEKQALIDQIKKINPCWITDAISRIQQAGDTLDLSNTKTGKYSKQQAQAWINEFNQSK